MDLPCACCIPLRAAYGNSAAIFEGFPAGQVESRADPIEPREGGPMRGGATPQTRLDTRYVSEARRTRTRSSWGRRDGINRSNTNTLFHTSLKSHISSVYLPTFSSPLSVHPYLSLPMAGPSPLPLPHRILRPNPVWLSQELSALLRRSTPGPPPALQRPPRPRAPALQRAAVGAVRKAPRYVGHLNDARADGEHIALPDDDGRIPVQESCDAPAHQYYAHAPSVA